MRSGIWLLLFCATTAQSYPYLPSPELTPGLVASTDTVLVCAKDYPAKARNVSRSIKNKVYRAHKVDKERCNKGCKIDHLIPLSIGGSNDPRNLWPHEYGADWNVFSKTRLEVRLRKEVCSGRMEITQAQECIRKDWTQCFQQFYQGDNNGNRK
jgi:hypothetical protein